jgi:transcriptional regulator with AAA-type ATPase domain
LPTRSSSHRFVGRARDLRQLRAALQVASAGHGRLVFVGGEPGIGKTRLVGELADYAEARRSALVLWSTCREGEGAPAFWLLLIFDDLHWGDA